jgi:F420-dependent oxidoreductase-like protein
LNYHQRLDAQEKGMRLGFMVGEGSGAGPDLTALVARGQAVEAAGLDTAWIANIALDAMTASAVLGQATSRIEIGTAVVPTYPRHPYAMAQQAVSTQLACAGRFSLGVGLAHKFLIERLYGLSYEKPARHMRAYLDVLAPLLRGEAVSHQSELYTVNAQPMAFAPPTPVLVAALGPVMLRLAGRVADGTITWATGLKTLEQHIVPGLDAGAEEAGRPRPRVVAGFPVMVTGKPDAARSLAAEVFGVYKNIPSYRAMLDREGADGVEDLAIVGDEAEVEAALRRLSEAGVSDFCGFPYEVDKGDIDRTFAFLGGLSL